MLRRRSEENRLGTRNPFSPSFGASPPVLAGRDAILDSVGDALSAGPTHPDYTALFIGVRRLRRAGRVPADRFHGFPVGADDQRVARGPGADTAAAPVLGGRAGRRGHLHLPEADTGTVIPATRRRR